MEEQARGWSADQRLALRQRESRPILDKLHGYLLEIQAEVLPKSPEGRATRYTLNNWTALNRYCEDGDLEIDNNRTERSIRGVAVGRNNWIFFGSDQGGHTAALPRRYRGVSWPRASGWESIPTPGSKMSSRGSLPIPSPGSPNCYRITGSPHKPDPET